MKKKGFTLIELLAVIVVLAIIALIATPIVMNVIKDASAGAAERSADNYIKAVETLIATENLDGTPLVDGEYTIDNNGKITLGSTTYEVEVSGTKPTGGTIKIENGRVVKDASKVNYSDYEITYSKGVPTAKEKGEPAILCTAIEPVAQPLFDPINPDTPKNTVVGVDAREGSPYAAGAVYQCDLGDGNKIFYVLREEGNNVKLLMSDDLGVKAWCSDEGFSCRMDDVITYLESLTSAWKKLFAADGTASLPTYADLEPVEGQEWISTNISPASGLHGYLTSTPVEGESGKFWIVGWQAQMRKDTLSILPPYAVRPTITISKDNMSL